MIAVIFEVLPHAERRQDYLDAASALRPHLEEIESLTNPGKILSLSFWRDEEAVRQWRSFEPHRSTQQAGRQVIFADYRLRVATVIRDYGLNDRGEVPEDSYQVHSS
jgi:heme-degrading monooxygenase HmoA